MSEVASDQRALVIEHAPNWADGIRKTFSSKFERKHFDVVPVHKGKRLPELENYDLLMLSGGEMGVYELNKPEYQHILLEYQLIEQAILLGIPVLAFCFGHQLVADVMGGKIERDESRREIGWHTVSFVNRSQAPHTLRGLPKDHVVFQYHNDHVVGRPSSAQTIASSSQSEHQMLYYPQEKILSTQFHPEIGRDVGNFLFDRDKEYLTAHELDHRQLQKESLQLKEQPRLRLAYQLLESLR